MNRTGLRLRRKVRRIVVMKVSEAGRWQPMTIYKKKRRKKKKRSRALRPLEKRVRRLARADRKFSGIYLKRHKKSTRKKRDGWLRDINYNIYRASRRRAKTLKIPRLL